MPRDSQTRTHSPATSCATRNGTPSRTSHSAMSVASEKPCGASDDEAVGVEHQRVDHAAERGQQDLEGVDRVEHRLLVLLEVAVVGQRQALEGREEPGEVADEPAGLAARELGDVGVLLLRHDARPGRVGVVERDEAELLGRPEDDLLGDARQVDRDHGRDEGELGDDVAGGGAVDRVLDRAVEAQVGGDGLGVEAERAAGEGAGAVGAEGGARVPVAQPVDVAQQRPGVGEEVVGEQDGLGVLQVRASGHRHAGCRSRLGDEGVDDVERPARRRCGRARGGTSGPAWRPGRCGSARRAAGRRPRRPARSMRPRSSAVCTSSSSGRGHEGARTRRRPPALAAGQHRGQVVVTEQTGGVEDPRVGARPGDVVQGEPPVEVRGPGQLRQGVGGAAGEAPSPQAEARLVGGLGRTVSLTRSPCGCRP